MTEQIIMKFGIKIWELHNWIDIWIDIRIKGPDTDRIICPSYSRRKKDPVSLLCSIANQYLSEKREIDDLKIPEEDWMQQIEIL